jgi:hypothetical protein
VPLFLDTPITAPSGLTNPTQYWRWVGLSIDVAARRATGTLHCYVSEEAFMLGKHPIAQKQYTIAGSDFATLSALLEPNLSTAIYNYVRGSDPTFHDATDYQEVSSS